jgi:hypothetical protein
VRSVTQRSSTARSYPVRVPRVPVGPLTPAVLGECSRWLSAQGYSPGSAAGVVNLLERLSVWMQVVGAGVDDIDEELLGRFVAAERSREVVCVTAMRALGKMRRFLSAGGYLGAGVVEGGEPTPAQVAVAGWSSWMSDHCGLTEKTVVARVRYAAGLLDGLAAADGGLDWTRLDTSVVNAYVVERGRPYGAVARAHIVTAVRACCGGR